MVPSAPVRFLASLSMFERFAYFTLFIFVGLFAGLEVSLVLLGAAIAFSVAAYVQYFRDTYFGIVAPNRWTWLIWSVATTVEALTYQAVSDDWIKSAVFFIASFSCIGIMLLIWSKARWENPKWTEVVCVIASGVALLLWLQFQFSLWAHLLMVLSVPIAFIPTWKSALQDPSNERSFAWALWSLGDLLTLFVILTRLSGAEELPFILVEFVSHVVVWRMVRAKW